MLNIININILNPSKMYYPKINVNPGMGYVENPFNLWLYQNRDKIITCQLKDFIGYYIIGMDG